jgi:cell division protein FtsB
VIASIRPYAPTALFAALIFYFAVNALIGDRGMLGDRHRESELQLRTSELQILQAEHAELAARARLLSDSYLSRDLLAERSRVLLGFTDPRDYVIRTKP